MTLTSTDDFGFVNVWVNLMINKNILIDVAKFISKIAPKRYKLILCRVRSNCAHLATGASHKGFR